MNDKILKLHYMVNDARMVMETLNYLNDRLEIFKDLTKEQAYFVTASAFRTFQFDEESWNRLKDSPDFLPVTLNSSKKLPYKEAIKKISDELYEKAKPEEERERESAEKEREREREEKEREERENEEVPDTKEEDGDTTRKRTDDAQEMNNVSMGDKKLNFHIEITTQLEEDLIQMITEGKMDEAHQFMEGFIYESLQAQLSEEDLIKAQNPSDFQIRKLGTGSNVELVTQFRNKSLIEALTCAHLGLVIVKKHEIEKKKAEDHKFDHFRENFYGAVDERIINNKRGAIAKALIDDSDGLVSGVDNALCPMCDHLDKSKSKTQQTGTIMDLNDKALAEELMEHERAEQLLQEEEMSMRTH